MRFRTSIGLLIAGMASMLLSGCVQPYDPPATGSTATLNIAIHNWFGMAWLDILPSPHSLTGEKRILSAKYRRGASASGVKISAGHAILFYFRQDVKNTNDYCEIPFSFSPMPNQTYDLFLGDLPAPPPDTLLGKIGHFFHPALNASCYINVGHILANGKPVKVKISRWSPGL
jgi:hypothetical protein